MKSTMLMYNDDLNGSTWMYKGHKLVVMGLINFEDHALIKRH
jgi:hypothetical protein